MASATMCSWLMMLACLFSVSSVEGDKVEDYIHWQRSKPRIPRIEKLRFMSKDDARQECHRFGLHVFRVDIQKYQDQMPYFTSFMSDLSLIPEWNTSFPLNLYSFHSDYFGGSPPRVYVNRYSDKLVHFHDHLYIERAGWSPNPGSPAVHQMEHEYPSFPICGYENQHKLQKSYGHVHISWSGVRGEEPAIYVQPLPLTYATEFKEALYECTKYGADLPITKRHKLRNKAVFTRVFSRSYNRALEKELNIKNTHLPIICQMPVQRCPGYGALIVPAKTHFALNFTFEEANKFCINSHTRIPWITPGYVECRKKFASSLHGIFNTGPDASIWDMNSRNSGGMRHVVCFVSHSNELYLKGQSLPPLDNLGLYEADPHRRQITEYTCSVKAKGVMPAFLFEHRYPRRSSSFIESKNMCTSLGGDVPHFLPPECVEKDDFVFTRDLTVKRVKDSESFFNSIQPFLRKDVVIHARVVCQRPVSICENIYTKKRYGTLFVPKGYDFRNKVSYDEALKLCSLSEGLIVGLTQGAEHCVNQFQKQLRTLFSMSTSTRGLQNHWLGATYHYRTHVICFLPHSNELYSRRKSLPSLDNIALYEADPFKQQITEFNCSSQQVCVPNLRCGDKSPCCYTPRFVMPAFLFQHQYPRRSLTFNESKNMCVSLGGDVPHFLPRPNCFPRQAFVFTRHLTVDDVIAHEQDFITKPHKKFPIYFGKFMVEPHARVICQRPVSICENIYTKRRYGTLFVPKGYDFRNKVSYDEALKLCSMSRGEESRGHIVGLTQGAEHCVNQFQKRLRTLFSMSTSIRGLQNHWLDATFHHRTHVICFLPHSNERRLPIPTFSNNL